MIPYVVNIRGAMKKTVLIVEDEEMLRKLETIVLKLRGYDVIAVSNGQAALDALTGQKPDLVLLDVMLPGIDGFDICQHIKNTPSTKDIPVILLTAKKTEEDMKMGFQVGADEYFTKPFRSAALVEGINKLLNREVVA